jgi:hypothetical protein
MVDDQLPKYEDSDYRFAATKPIILNGLVSLAAMVLIAAAAWAVRPMLGRPATLVCTAVALVALLVLSRRRHHRLVAEWQAHERSAPPGVPRELADEVGSGTPRQSGRVWGALEVWVPAHRLLAGAVVIAMVIGLLAGSVALLWFATHIGPRSKSGDPSTSFAFGLFLMGVAGLVAGCLTWRQWPRRRKPDEE